eukprot:CAMPEP_0194550916 /NCGR_PEP_ID=MMETSP0253-20130528/95957_1 /TAXON_ID=2966 /ORGANISM="Noctiluca scintillans" /LENGTH=241 /DNA_ID=CAMNT_0039398367 /DNA_START=119 /DNA_END=845 /DNA_ORIENTATION=-
MATEECQSSVQQVHCMVHTFASAESTGVCRTKVGRCTASSCASMEELLTILSEESDTFQMSDFQCTTCSTDLCNEEDVELSSINVRLVVIVQIRLVRGGTMSFTCIVGRQSDCGGVGLVGTMSTEECQSSVQHVQCMVHTFAAAESTGVCQTKVARCTSSSCADMEKLFSLLSNQSDTFDMSDFQCTVCSTDLCNEEDVGTSPTPSTCLTFNVPCAPLTCAMRKMWSGFLHRLSQASRCQV